MFSPEILIYCFHKFALFVVRYALLGKKSLTQYQLAR
jgi:hypothetical protein